jgi:hypothetical protein
MGPRQSQIARWTVRVKEITDFPDDFPVNLSFFEVEFPILVGNYTETGLVIDANVENDRICVQPDAHIDQKGHGYVNISLPLDIDVITKHVAICTTKQQLVCCMSISYKVWIPVERQPDIYGFPLFSVVACNCI